MGNTYNQNFIIASSVALLTPDERFMIVDFIQEELLMDRNLYSEVPEIAGFDPHEWTDESVDQYLADNHEGTRDFVLKRFRWAKDGWLYLSRDTDRLHK